MFKIRSAHLCYDCFLFTCTAKHLPASTTDQLVGVQAAHAHNEQPIIDHWQASLTCHFIGCIDHRLIQLNSDRGLSDHQTINIAIANRPRSASFNTSHMTSNHCS